MEGKRGRKGGKMSVKDALPCPFCGSDNLRDLGFGIECRNCGAWMGEGTQCHRIGNTVLEAWNHRVSTVSSIQLQKR